MHPCWREKAIQLLARIEARTKDTLKGPGSSDAVARYILRLQRLLRNVLKAWYTIMRAETAHYQAAVTHQHVMRHDLLKS